MDQPTIGSAEETAIFIQPRGQVFVTWLWVIALVWAACCGLYVLIRFALGMMPGPGHLVAVLESLLIVPAVGASLCMLVSWRQLGWLHSSVHGIEFAATGRRAVTIPWSGVASVALRRRGVFTELVITPSGPHAVTAAPGPGRRPRASAGSYLVDVGLMSPGPAVLLQELHRRIPAKV